MKYFLFVLCLLLPASLFAATLRVNNTAGTSPNYATIQAAINAAADGDTILIEGSTTAYAPFDLINKRLTLVGPGYSLASNLGTPANKLGAIVSGGSSYIRTQAESAGTANGTLVMGLDFKTPLYLEGCSNVTITRCQFPNTGSNYLNVYGPNNIIRQCYFRSGYPINFSPPSGATPSGNRIENCLMPLANLQLNGDSSVIFYVRNNLLRNLSDSLATLVVENNIFLEGVSDPFMNSVLRNNLCRSFVPDMWTGTGNIAYTSIQAIMANADLSPYNNDNRYQLSPLSAANPAYNAGTDGTHIGPFGGANPYVLSGVPPLPTIDELSVPQFAAPGTNLTIRIKVSERP